jgi:hypothetical protein
MNDLTLAINTAAAPIAIGTIGLRLPGVKGDTGLSAYASAVLGGYMGDEATFYSDLAALQGLAALLEDLL